MRNLVLSAVLLMPAAALACPALPDSLDAQLEIINALQDVQNEGSARPLSDQLWLIWTKAPDEHAQAILDRGISAQRVADLDRAYQAFDELVAYCPDYAEGYNQRAFVSFLRQDYVSALADLDLAIARSPVHVAAIAGKALTLMGLGRDDEAQTVLRQALTLNPWLSERRFLKPDPETDL